MHHLYNNIWQDKDGSFVLIGIDGHWMKISSDGLSFRDKYGNVTTIDGAILQYKQNSPTYDELYEHWLKTKQND